MSIGPATPVLFIAHGSPMNALGGTPWSEAIGRLGGTLRGVTAIAALSAHWYLPARRVASAAHPRTIHDFSGFPRELHDITYPAPGDPALAERIVALLGSDAALDPQQGFDHGVWSVLRHLVPDHRFPVVPISIDRRCTPAQHIACGRTLAALRSQGVLLVCSGNITHNLGHAMQALRTGSEVIPPWASRFDAAVAAAAKAHDADALARLLETPDGRLAHPSEDHLLPLLYALGASGSGDAVSFPTEGFELASLSMRSIRFG